MSLKQDRFSALEYFFYCRKEAMDCQINPSTKINVRMYSAPASHLPPGPMFLSDLGSDFDVVIVKAI
jgi:hypothetical protein